MIGTLIGVLIYLIVAGVIWWGAEQIISLIPMPEIIKVIIRVIMILLVIVIVVYALVSLLGLIGIHVPLSIGK